MASDHFVEHCQPPLVCQLVRPADCQRDAVCTFLFIRVGREMVNAATGLGLRLVRRRNICERWCASLACFFKLLLVRTVVYTTLMRNITLSAADQLIDQARDKARAQGVTLNDEFRKWLASYVETNDGQSAVNRFRSVMQALPNADAGRSFSRDEMNER